MAEIHWRCDNCGAIVTDSALLRAPNPFSEKDVVHGCPECKAIGALDQVCDEPGCTALATAGFPVDGGGYRHTCFSHSKWGAQYGR